MQQIQYIPHNHSFISCSASGNNSLVISDIEQKKKPYVFNLRKVRMVTLNIDGLVKVLCVGLINHSNTAVSYSYIK